MAQSHAPPVALRITYITYPTAIRDMGGVKLNIRLAKYLLICTFFYLRIIKFGCKDTTKNWNMQVFWLKKYFFL